MKFRLRFLRRQLDHVHLVQLFLTGHGHITGGDAGLVARYKILQVGDFLLLLVVGSLQLRLFHGVHFLKFIIIAHIAVQLLIVHVVDQVDHAV